ncbi:hypothetical protein DFA_07039 [Cavenderia fasciculata]|uniref:Transmembrane protein n=1 Tax=Cavenderia fasciculata TaxID=261658 RepID=F4PVB7_CACFS|nr:uncharacterized protein DFA_07039 [Cavenderia fasciculata]EGG19931.1 hypothetical protein DFA_07039 [Cavenderia fasciculata]|eukprot:XP_004366914.1 hypothetical protein DFA_07039 [Cavenderia fasciculata]
MLILYCIVLNLKLHHHYHHKFCTVALRSTSSTRGMTGFMNAFGVGIQILGIVFNMIGSP